MSNGKNEFKMPKPIPLPRSTYAALELNENHPQSARKVQSSRKIKLRPLKEVLSTAEYELFFGSATKKTIQTEPEVRSIGKRKSVRETVLNYPKTKIQQPTTLTKLSRDTKRLETDSALRKVKRTKTNFVQLNKKNIKKIVKETPKLMINNEYFNSANSKDSDKEFSVYEKLCKSYQRSPLTKLYNSLDVSELENTIDIESNDYPEIINEIKQLIHKEEQQHRRFVTNITNLLQKLENSLSTKENRKMVSNKKKQSINNGYCSPLSDLRQNIFHKNIAKKLEYNDEKNSDGMKIQKAVEMYNNFREDCNFLCTPKPNHKTTPNTTRRSLSARIQEQCLLLVQTPKP